MFKFFFAAALAAAAAWWPAQAFADNHFAVLHDGLVISSGDADDLDDTVDVVSVAEPATQYVVANDTIITPYGYRPYYSQGYYQGYAYNPQYTYNPYYEAAAYSPVDPVSTA